MRWENLMDFKERKEKFYDRFGIEDNVTAQVSLVIKSAN